MRKQLSCRCTLEEDSSNIARMEHVGSFVRAWRTWKNLSERTLAERGGISVDYLEAIEGEREDPPHSTVSALAEALHVPVSWLFVLPSQIDLLFKEDDESPELETKSDQADPVLQRMLQASGRDRNLYVLLTALVQSGEPKLLRAAEMSLKSLVKQSRQATVPWQSRPPGHFEPPSD
ncbi:MAG TPA: helix-turn-helix transcriptional regulator [Nitrospiraceae bacterium]|nr:helix-turn-helix transcriptional regulator [Nitrospiraceae bacterium]